MDDAKYTSVTDLIGAFQSGTSSTSSTSSNDAFASEVKTTAKLGLNSELIRYQVPSVRPP
jgi:hypothetical protein